MSEELNLEDILKKDDVETFKAHWKSDKHGNIDQIISNTQGEDVTVAFAAAHFKAAKILKYLIEHDGNPDFISQGFAVRDVAKQNLDCLLAMIEGGMKPNSTELSQIFFSTRNNSVPKDGHLHVLNDFISSNGKDNLAGGDEIVDFSDMTLVKKLFRKNDSFKFLLTEGFEALDSVKGQRTSIATETRKIANEAMDNTISIFLIMLNEAVMLVQNHSDILYAAVKSNFQGYRKNTKWLKQKFQSSVADVTSEIAKRLDRFEDDQDLLNQVSIALHRFPIDEVAKAQTVTTASNHNDGLAFEARCQEHLSSAGFATEATASTGDQGADIIALKDGLKYIIQCKDYEKPVGNRAIQEVIAAKQYYAGDYAVVCARNGFTKSAKALASTASILLVKELSLSKLDVLAEILD